MAKKEKFKLEFELRSSPRILYNFISTPNGLSQWFADDVTVMNGIYTFNWAGDENRAKIIHKRDLEMVKFKWMDEKDDTFFELEIVQDDITSDIALVITDFAEPDDKDETMRLWEAQVQDLKHVIGS